MRGLSKTIFDYVFFQEVHMEAQRICGTWETASRKIQVTGGSFLNFVLKVIFSRVAASTFSRENHILVPGPLNIVYLPEC